MGAYGDCKYRICPNSAALMADGTFDDICSQSPTSCAVNSSPYYPEPPPECATGWGGTGCDVWEGCPSGYKTYGQNCLEDSPDKCYASTLVVGIGTESYMQPVEVPCGTEGEKSTSSSDGCSVFSSDYISQVNGIPVCKSSYADALAPNLPADCRKTKGGYVNGVYTTVCVESGAKDSSDSVVDCPTGSISIDGDCKKTGSADRDEKTETHFNEDGSRTETKHITETYYNADGSVETNKWTETQNYNSEGEKDGEADVSEKETSIEKGSDNKASSSGSCSAPPACSGDAIQCSILRQNWLNMCETKSLSDKLGGDAESSVSGSSSCESTPVCSGDAVQCAILHNVHQQRCKDDPENPDYNIDAGELESALSGAESDLNAAIDGAFSQFASDTQTEIAAAGGVESMFENFEIPDFTADYEQDLGSCPNDEIVIDLDLFGSLSFSVAEYCDRLTLVGTLVRTSAALYCFFVVFGFFRDL